MRVIKKIADDLVESTKLQHEISKAQMEVNKVSVQDAKKGFKENHEYAKKPHIQKQQEQLNDLKAKIAHKDQ